MSEAKRSNPRIEFALSSKQPKYRPPGGKPLIVHFVVNIVKADGAIAR